ncbi:monovalent cation/H(+) antiporter subunit G [Granulicoccus sp. GXG6511]|uniref:monovalent cation/H(+) antiporter subunit G n=1 Tax=Granulicoccus sp. GXG6511 TaxID=3381351 RepID=UPI003D7EC952
MTFTLPETVGAVLDLIALLCVLLGAFLCVAASIGLLRFPDLLSRMHAATKPQVLGVLLVVFAVALTMRSIPVITMAALVAVFQLLTAPVASQMLSRAGVRTAQVQLGRVDGDPVNPAHPPTPKKKRKESAEDRDSSGKTSGDSAPNPDDPSSQR